MLRFGGQLQLAGDAEIAGDLLFGDEAPDRLDAGVEGAIHRLRLLRPEGLACREIGMGEPVVEMPTVPARSTKADMLRFQYSHGTTGQREAPRGGEAREASADHSDIYLRGKLPAPSKACDVSCQ